MTRPTSKTTVGKASDLGVDVGAKWATTCELHNTLVGSSSKRLAQASARNTAEWCDACRDEEETDRIVPKPDPSWKPDPSAMESQLAHYQSMIIDVEDGVREVTPAQKAELHRRLRIISAALGDH